MNDAKIKNTGFYDEHGCAKAVLLYEGDRVKIERKLEGLFLCQATCRNSNRKVIAEVETENLQFQGGEV